MTLEKENVVDGGRTSNTLTLIEMDLPTSRGEERQGRHGSLIGKGWNRKVRVAGIVGRLERLEEGMDGLCSSCGGEVCVT